MSYGFREYGRKPSQISQENRPADTLKPHISYCWEGERTFQDFDVSCFIASSLERFRFQVLAPAL